MRMTDTLSSCPESAAVDITSEVMPAGKTASHAQFPSFREWRLHLWQMFAVCKTLHMRRLGAATRENACSKTGLTTEGCLPSLLDLVAMFVSRLPMCDCKYTSKLAMYPRMFSTREVPACQYMSHRVLRKQVADAVAETSQSPAFVIPVPAVRCSLQCTKSQPF